MEFIQLLVNVQIRSNIQLLEQQFLQITFKLNLHLIQINIIIFAN